MNAHEDKGAAHADFLRDAFLAGRDVELRFHLEGAAHDRGLGFDGEVEEVADLTGGDVDVEIDDVAFAFDIDDGAGAGEAGAAEFGRDWIERGVAAGAVDDGVEAGVERHGAVRSIEGEGGHVSDAVDEDAVELADKSSGRVKHAPDAFDGAEVGVGEGVVGR